MKTWIMELKRTMVREVGRETLPSDPKGETARLIRFIASQKKRMQISAAMEKWKEFRKVEAEEDATVTTV